jgi:hypothetical protein
MAQSPHATQIALAFTHDIWVMARTMPVNEAHGVEMAAHFENRQITEKKWETPTLPKERLICCRTSCAETAQPIDVSNGKLSKARFSHDGQYFAR